jgi:hypothetical protein
MGDSYQAGVLPYDSDCSCFHHPSPKHDWKKPFLSPVYQFWCKQQAGPEILRIFQRTLKKTKKKKKLKKKKKNLQEENLSVCPFLQFKANIGGSSHSTNRV